MQDSRFITAALSILGTRRTQQDTALVCEQDGSLLAVVCDGMGGVSGGEIASGMAVATIRALFTKKPPAQTGAEFLRTAATAMDEAVYRLVDQKGERLRAGTTVAAILIEGAQLTWLSAGDSRIYLIRGGEMIRVTRDHNYFMRIDSLLAEGKLTQEQYAVESVRGESLLSYLGIGGLDLLDINELPLIIEPGDKVLLTSDGLYRAVDDQKIQAIVSEYGAQGAVMALTSLAKKNSPEALDNTTCVIIHYIGGEVK